MLDVTDGKTLAHEHSKILSQKTRNKVVKLIKTDLFWRTDELYLLDEIQGWLQIMCSQLAEFQGADHVSFKELLSTATFKPMNITSHGMDVVLEQTGCFREPILNFYSACPDISDMQSGTSAVDALSGFLTLLREHYSCPMDSVQPLTRRKLHSW